MSLEQHARPHHAGNRRIDPVSAAETRAPAALRPDGTPDDEDRVEIGPTALAFAEWRQAGLTPPHLPTMRADRLARLVAGLQERDCAACLLFDPLNIRYATDTTNMQLWNAHNPFRACLVAATGHVVVWDFKDSGLLTGFNPLIDETRGAASMFYFVCGDLIEEDARRFAGEVDSLLREQAGGNRRLAVDKIMIHGLRALERLGIEVTDGEELCERTRAVKTPEEIRAMRCAVAACENALETMRAAVRPGASEADVWAVLHAENIRRGGEWIETRILSSGPRTNPWFQECGPRHLREGDLLAFDTDLIGCYGICTDISRTWLVGDRPASDEQKRLFAIAHRQIEDSIPELRPGRMLPEIVHACPPLPEEFVAQRYSCRMHGVGLCDEWPLVSYPQDHRDSAYEHRLEAGMVMCVETYIGAVGGREGIKLEDQVLITEDGPERLSLCPHDPRLLG